MKSTTPEIHTTTVGTGGVELSVFDSAELEVQSCPPTLPPTRTSGSATGTCSDSRQTPHVVFLGLPAYLSLVFPPSLRAEVSEVATVLGETDAEQLAEFDGRERTEIILSTWGMPTLDAGLLDSMPLLRAVFYAAGTVRSFATPEAFRRGIVISSAAGASAIPVAEFAATAVLFALKRVFPQMRATRDHNSFCRMPMPGAYKTRVGLVSLGVIGQLTARKLQSLDVEILACDPFATEETAADLGVRLVDLQELFAVCDVVSIHTRHLPETEGMIGADLLASMKEGATLINTARGVIIDEPALCRILEARPDLTALLDVTHPEPPVPGSPLFRLPNVFLTPHIAGSMDGEVERMGRWMVDEFASYLQGNPLQHRVTQEMLRSMA